MTLSRIDLIAANHSSQNKFRSGCPPRNEGVTALDHQWPPLGLEALGLGRLIAERLKEVKTREASKLAADKFGASADGDLWAPATERSECSTSWRVGEEESLSLPPPFLRSNSVHFRSVARSLAINLLHQRPRKNSAQATTERLPREEGPLIECDGLGIPINLPLMTREELLLGRVPTEEEGI